MNEKELKEERKNNEWRRNTRQGKKKKIEMIKEEI